MRKVWKKGAAALLAAVMCAGALSGCGKNSEAISAFKFNGEKVDGDLVNFALRYEQSTVDDMYEYYASMMGQDIWSMDDGQGLGITTWDNFKSSIAENIQKLLLAEEHAKDYDIALTDDEKKAITDAASAFISANDEEVLKSMSATQEVVERYLTLCTIQAKVEEAMCADVDTNVSDEEAAQRTVDYISYTPTTEAQTEAESESEMAGTEADVENVFETEADLMNTVQTEGETSPVETEEANKTKAGDETESALTEAEQALTEAEAAEAESEIEDLAMAEAKVRYREMAEEQLEVLLSSDGDIATLMEDAAHQAEEDGVQGISHSSFTFGKDDTYPDASIIEATNDLPDGTLVDEVIEAGDVYYILYVEKALDEEATEDKKEEIIDERKAEKIAEVYDGWIADEKFEVDSEVLNALVKERSYTMPEESEETLDTEMIVSTEAEASNDVSTEAEIVSAEVEQTETEA